MFQTTNQQWLSQLELKTLKLWSFIDVGLAMKGYEKMILKNGCLWKMGCIPTTWPLNGPWHRMKWAGTNRNRHERSITKPSPSAVCYGVQQCIVGPQTIAKLVYNSKKCGLWYLIYFVIIDVIRFHGLYITTNITTGDPTNDISTMVTMAGMRKK